MICYKVKVIRRLVLYVALTMVLLSYGEQSLLAAPYTVTDMGISGLPVINNNSQVAGERSVNGPAQALLWENGNITDLGTLPGHQESSPFGISDTGQIVGNSRGGLIPNSAFLWENGVMMDLGTLSGNTASSALGINNFEQVVGVSQGGSSIEQAFIWENGVMTGLGTLGGSESSASAINDLAQVVGTSRTASGVNRPFLWENGSMVDLGVITGTASPFDINNAGKVVGAGDNLANNSGRALLWDNGDIVNLGILPGHTGSSAAFAINNNDQIVGDSSGPLGATLWQDGNIFNLNNLIDDGNWSLLVATDINDFGEIVGMGINPNGIRTTFLLTPTGEPISDPVTENPIPEPSTLLLLASGLAGLAAWRRRKAA